MELLQWTRRTQHHTNRRNHKDSFLAKRKTFTDTDEEYEKKRRLNEFSECSRPQIHKQNNDRIQLESKEVHYLYLKHQPLM